MTTDVPETKAPETKAPEPSTAKSTVDTWLDALTVQTARGLVITQNALVGVARWLDRRAVGVGELAAKLRTHVEAPPAAPPESPATP